MSANSPGVVERLLAGRIGLDPSSVGENLITRGVLARMSALGLRSRADYDRTIAESPDELQALVEEVVVPESWFFRDERPFATLGRFAQAWILDPTRPPLSVLSLPCASGEEPYSMALTLLETGLPAERFRIDAVDVSARSIARAIAGVYGPNAFRGVSAARRSTDFREQAGTFTLDVAVRSTVHFRLGNLLDPTLFADREPFDVVFCRNLLIYLDDAAMIRAFATLTRLVADGGLLFLGHADRLEALDGSAFEPWPDKGAFAYRKVGANPRVPAKPYHFNPPRPVGKEPEKKNRQPWTPTLPRQAGGSFPGKPSAPTLLPKRVESPGPARPDPSSGSRPPGPVESWFEEATALADAGRYDEATQLVERSIGGGRADSRAYFLLGMIAQASGSRDQAEGFYLKAIYLDPEHDEVLLALALLARRKGDVAAEAAYRRRAERVRSRKVLP